MSYEVVAPLVLAKDRRGSVHYAYEGAKLREDVLDPVQAGHLLAEGLIVRVADPEPELADEDPGDPADDPETADGVQPKVPEKPARIALKGVLVDWLDKHTDYTRSELEEQNKDDLWELIDVEHEKLAAAAAAGSED